MGPKNVYCDRVGAFTGDDLARAEDLASHLAVTISDGTDIQDRDQNATTPTVIGQAQGILMERYVIGAKEAFALLHRISQDGNRAVVQIAQELVDTRHLPHVGPTTEDQAITR